MTAAAEFIFQPRRVDHWAVRGPSLEEGAEQSAILMLTVKELATLAVFRQFLVTPGEMLCFPSQLLEQHRESLAGLAARDLLVKERYQGGYSLTRAGYAAMRSAG